MNSSTESTVQQQQQQKRLTRSQTEGNMLKYFTKTLQRNEHDILPGKDIAILTFRGAGTSSLSSNGRDLH